MREIKFRARHKESGRWRTFTLDELCDGHMTERYMWEHWREFTGLKDKNGVEIYEGDIVRQLREDKRFRPLVGEVTVRNGFTWIEDKLDPQGFGGMQYDPSTVEFIGNIYENPELLK